QKRKIPKFNVSGQRVCSLDNAYPDQNDRLPCFCDSLISHSARHDLPAVTSPDSRESSYGGRKKSCPFQRNATLQRSSPPVDPQNPGSGRHTPPCLPEGRRNSRHSLPN